MPKQLPDPSEIFLDHVAHFVPRLDAAGSALERLGFCLTPFTAQQNRTPQGMVPAGMANRCIMLREGYLEFLTAIGDTDLARQFGAATARYVGLHLIAFATADPEGAHAAMAAGGFQPKEPVALTRPVEDAEGRQLEARFTVLRVPPEVMPEGRIQMLQHHTEEAVWQDRWLDHENGIVSLKAVLLAVADPEEAARRFGRFVGRTPERRDARWVLPLERGRCVFVDGDGLAQAAPWARPWVGAPARLPRIVATALGSRDAGLTRNCFDAGGLEAAEAAGQQSVYAFPPELGGFTTVVPVEDEASWAS
jgi:hypothetical protein